MTGRRAVVGLCMLCALIVSAFAAQSASALGTTAYTCKNTGAGGTFTAAHCKPSDAGSGNFSHVSIANGTTTEIIGSDLATDGTTHTGAILKSTSSGVPFTLAATEVSGSGTMSNKEEGGEMYAHGEGTITYKGVTETSGLGCEVEDVTSGLKGEITTNLLTATTQGQGDKLKFQPKTGTVFAEFKLLGAGCALNGKVIPVVGSVLGIPDGATTNTVHTTVTADKTLRTGSTTGPFAGIAGTLTISGRVTGSGGAYTPLSVTT